MFNVVAGPASDPSLLFINLGHHEQRPETDFSLTFSQANKIRHDAATIYHQNINRH